jgi:hypothetical protein
MSQETSTSAGGGGGGTGGRSRRTRKHVNYGAEQTFSDLDEDVFEDEPVPSSTTGTSSSRKKAARAPRRSVNDDDEGGWGAGGGGGRGPSSSSYKSTSQSSTPFSSGGGSGRPAYVERGYDTSFPPLRERFAFEPEYEDDGTPSIECIVGRRPIDDARDRTGGATESKKSKKDDAGGGDGDVVDDDDDDGVDDEEDDEAPRRRRSGGGAGSRKRKAKGSTAADDVDDPDGAGVGGRSEMDYEYLIKYKGRSYLHLEWKTAADLESMNSKAKTIYRRFLKKLETGATATEIQGGANDEDLEDPTFDPSYTEPGRILAEEDHEITVELSDKELLKWEKEQKREMEEEEEDMDEESDGDVRQNEEGGGDGTKEKKEGVMEADGHDTKEEDIDIGDPGSMTIELIRRIVARDEPYYPKHPDSDNPYRDGYITEPPRKPRPSYLFYQGIYRSYFGKKYPKKSLPEVMAILGESWKNLTEAQQMPYIIMANEEATEFEREKALLEKAQRPTEMWQPIRRCQAVLDRLCNDPFATIFLEPVDTTVFTDYLDIVDSPMDLQTARKKLGQTKNWQGPEVFARDVRKIWNNCKIYNQHGSQIWHVADYMSKLFERLYHAWVLDFRDRYQRWAAPTARPWEPTCRASDGQCTTPDAQMVLCDHCDAAYCIHCVKPKLKKVPKGAWHCPTCAPKVGKSRTVSILSAVTEQAARKRAEMGDIPKKQVKQKMFLVKWAGLGYEHCTWETQEDINDDAIIAEFRRIEGVVPEEPNLIERDVRGLIESATAINPGNVGGGAEIVALRSQLHAQTRNFQFKKFGMDAPRLLGAECGPREKLMVCPDNRQPFDVASIVEELVWKVANNDRDFSNCHHQSSLPPLLNGEYDVVLPGKQISPYSYPYFYDCITH